MGLPPRQGQQPQGCTQAKRVSIGGRDVETQQEQTGAMAVDVGYRPEVEQRQAGLRAEALQTVRRVETGELAWWSLAGACSFAALQIAEQVALVHRLPVSTSPSSEGSTPETESFQLVESITERGLKGAETTSVEAQDAGPQRPITVSEGPELSQTEAEWLRATAALTTAWLGGPREALRRIRRSEVRRCEAAGHGPKLRRAQQAVEAFWRHRPAPQTVERWLADGGPSDPRLLLWTQRLLAACRALQRFGQTVAPVPVRAARPPAPAPTAEQLDAMLAKVNGVVERLEPEAEHLEAAGS